MDKLVKSFGREKKNSSPKCPKNEVIDLCDYEDDETVESFSSSESVKSVAKRARNEIGSRSKSESEMTSSLRITLPASNHQRNDLIGGSGTGFGGVLLHPNHSSTGQPCATKNNSSRAGTGKTRNIKRKKNGGKRKRKGKNKRRDSSSGCERQSAWSNREMRVGPYHEPSIRRSGGSNQYMQISKLDPALRNVGGAEITFN